MNQGKNAACFFAVLAIVTGLSSASPVLEVVGESTKEPVTNGTETATPQPVTPAKLQKQEKWNDVTKDKARECTLKAIQIILANSDDIMSKECLEILRAMTKNAAKYKDGKKEDGETDLRKELKALAEKEGEYESMKGEIEQAENLLADKRFDQTENLEEVKNTKNDDAAILEMESEKKATKVDAAEPSYGKGYLGRNSPKADEGGKEDNFLYSFPDEREAQFPIPDKDEDMFQNGKFVVGDTGIGVIAEPDDTKRSSIDDDFLVIPLRFLRKELMLGEKNARNGEREYARKPLRQTKSKDNDAAATWLLRSVLDMVAEEKEDDSRPDKHGMLDINNERKGKDHKTEEYEQGGPTGRMADGDLQEAGRDKAVVGQYDLEGDNAVSNIRELNRDLLGRVENDILQLGEDLHQLQFNSTH